MVADMLLDVPPLGNPTFKNLNKELICFAGRISRLEGFSILPIIHQILHVTWSNTDPEIGQGQGGLIPIWYINVLIWGWVKTYV